MDVQVVLTITGPADHLRLIWQTGETLLEAVEFREDPEGTRYHVLLALQEMATNVLRHAYQNDPSRPLEVTFAVGPEVIDITLRDQGPPFNPLEHDTSRMEEAMGLPMAAGGYGIYVTKAVMDEVDYERRHGWNCLRMRKLVRQGAGSLAS